MNQVALIAPYQEMAYMAKEICRDFEKPILINVGDLQEGLKKGRLLAKRGAEVIISRGGTAQLLREHLPIPIVGIRVTAYDILRALKKVPKGCLKIGIIGFGNVLYSSYELGDLLDLDLAVFTIQKEADVPIKLKEAKDNNVDIIIGDKIVVSQATRRGQKSILIESGKESILQSFHEAYEILSVARSEAKKTKQYIDTLNQLKAVLDSVEDQIIILDSSDRIQSCNPSALHVFDKKKQIKGQPLSLYPIAPLKELKTKSIAIRNYLAHVQGKYVLLDYMPIKTNGEITGTLIIGKNISNLQKAERKIRKELYLKGHVARFSFSDLVGEDDTFQKTIRRARSFASSRSTVLILGETGTGKEMFVQSIHNETLGTERPFVAINCATLPEPLLESELFGYAPGAFTGAKKKGKKGFFELAHSGTLLLDEIGELPISLQSRLLRVIQEREVQPIGDDRVIPVDVRIIASSNKDLSREIMERKFRADLFYRLNVLQLKVPPLRERGVDAFVLFKHFIFQINPKCRIRDIFCKKVKKLLCEHQWPGNVRELRNLVERLAIITDNFSRSFEEVTEWLREEIQRPDEMKQLDIESETRQLSLKEIEKVWARKLSESSDMKKSELAKLLGVSRTTLWKMRKTY